jgi:hypothetical protein
MAEREKTVLTLYYYEGLTLAEIGDILGVTESRVCQIHTKAVLQLRAKLADRPEAAGRRTDGEDQVVEGPYGRVQGDGCLRRGGQAPRSAASGSAKRVPHIGQRLSPEPPGPPVPSGAPGVRRTTMDGPRQPARRTSGISPHPAASTVAPHQGCCGREEQPSQGAVTWPSSP